MYVNPDKSFVDSRLEPSLVAARSEVPNNFAHSVALIRGEPLQLPLTRIRQGTCKFDETWLTSSPAQRLGPVSSSRASLLLITVASRCYHAIRMGNARTISRAVRANRFVEIYDLLLELAVIFHRDLS